MRDLPSEFFNVMHWGLLSHAYIINDVMVASQQTVRQTALVELWAAYQTIMQDISQVSAAEPMKVLVDDQFLTHTGVNKEVKVQSN